MKTTRAPLAILGALTLAFWLLAMPPSTRASSVVSSAQIDNGVSAADGTDLAVGNWVRIGRFDIPDAMVATMSVSQLTAHWISYEDARIGDAFDFPGHWSKNSIRSPAPLALEDTQIQLWILRSTDTSTLPQALATAIEHGVFYRDFTDNDEWRFKPEAAIPNTANADLSDLTDEPGTALIAGAHVVVGAFPKGTSDVTGAPNFGLVAVSVADTMTQAPLLSAPTAATAYRSPVPIGYTLPEAAANGTVKLTFAGSATKVLTLSNAQGTAGAHAFTFDPANPAGTPEITSGNAIPVGTYTVTLSYRDALLNPAASVSANNVTIDTVPPETTIKSGPVGAVTATEATFAFSSNEPGSTFLASIDGGPIVPVTNPTTYTGLSPGAHTFSVSARDAAGNDDPTPATRAWTILVSLIHTAHGIGGDAVPGAGTGPISAGAVWSDFGVPAINDAGAVACLGKWNSPAGAGAGIFVDDQLVAAVGGSTTALDPAKFATFGDPVLDAAGHVAFLATIAGAGVTPASDTVLVTNAFGALEVAVREGTTTSGAGSPKLKVFKSVSLVDDELLFIAKLQGGLPLVTILNDLAAYRVASLGSLTPVVRTGDPFGATTVKGFNLLTPVTGSPGQNRGHAAGTATFLALLADSTQALVASTGGPLNPLAATGDKTGSAALPDATFKGFRIPAADGTRLAFFGKLQPGVGGIVSGANQAIFMGDATGFEPVARVGSPTGIGTTTFGSLQDPVLAPALDSVAFPAILRGTTPARDTSLWWQPAGSPLTLLAREGAQPPGVPTGAKWTAFTSLALPGISAASDTPRGPIFVATLLPGAGGVDATNNLGVWTVDTSGALRLLFRKGDTITGRLLKNFAVLNAVSGSSGVTRAFNNHGQLAWRARFTDGSSAIVVTQIP